MPYIFKSIAATQFLLNKLFIYFLSDSSTFGRAFTWGSFRLVGNYSPTENE